MTTREINKALYQALVVERGNVADLDLVLLDHLVALDLTVPDEFILNPAGVAFLDQLRRIYAPRCEACGDAPANVPESDYCRACDDVKRRARAEADSIPIEPSDCGRLGHLSALGVCLACGVKS